MAALTEARRSASPGYGTDMDDLRPEAEEDAPRRRAPSPDGIRCRDGELYAHLLDEFQAAIDVRVERERQMAAEHAVGEDDRERQLRERLEKAEATHAAALSSLESEFESRLNAVAVELDTLENDARDEHAARIREIEASYHSEISELESRRQDSTWVTSSVLDDTADDSPLRQFERASQVRERLRDQQLAEMDGVESTYRTAIAERGWREASVPEPDLRPTSLDDAQAQFTEQIEAARAGLVAASSLRIPKLFAGHGWLILLAALIAAAFAPIYLLIDPSLLGMTSGEGVWAAVSAGAAGLIALAIVAVIYAAGSSRQSGLFLDAQQSLANANALHQRWRELASRDHQQQLRAFEARQKDFAAQRQKALDRYQHAYDERREELEQTRAQGLQAESDCYTEVQQALRTQRTEQVQGVESAYAERRRALNDAAERDRAGLAAEIEESAQNRRRRQSELWHELKTDWDAATRRFESGLQQAQAECAAQFSDWRSLAEEGWTPSVELPQGIRRGEYRINLAQWENAVPADMRLAPRSTEVTLPSVAGFPESASLLLRSADANARAAATRLLQSVLLRWLSLIPPGKLRLTIIDPVGLGESFAGFMHLADFDELLVTKRIWTEPDQIEQQLADLTQHMENVLQKYLRNEFATIEEYNEFAGEVAEPYRLLVITDFPAKFSELAARRLTSIVASGPRCGVFTLLSLDPKRDLPHGFDPAVLDEKLPALNWTRRSERSSRITDLLAADSAQQPVEPAATEDQSPGYRVASGLLSRWPLTIDEPPPPEQFTALVRRIGDASKEARRVEVSFERIAPVADQLWTHSSRSGIDLPLGRAGATKLQHLRLGKGTSQHMLIAGKTGSGKSTFLHCLITNLALHYSPDEIRFSLVDFKKGVEFKDYAAFQLPHADVIAIESDREFGVSVLQRLDGVLQERGDLFRRQGVQDLAGYRDACPDDPLPRLLLVIDEFQEFFVEEDRLSQTAALLMDRLIRQGRAFGMHVVLGSQTLGGAYSLARSTMGQVAVRVALQCSEADAHLILSEENTAARLLTRPGEAIYNDANGMVEGNHPFQIAWLPDDQRETWLRRLQSASESLGRSDAPPIVFEGNIPSDPARNAPLVGLLRSHAAGETPAVDGAAPQVWLGEAVEIKPPTSITFERRNGANVLLVGQDSDAALGIMTTTAVTLAAQVAPTGGGSDPSPSIVVLDGSPPDSPDAAVWRSLAGRFPGTIQVLGPRGAEAALRDLADDLTGRTDDPDTSGPPRFLFIHHVSRFRDLRKADDDFGVSFGGAEDKPVEPSKLFTDLLANGPTVGIHTLVWCDSANTVERWFSRTTMRELENRIAFQMNSSDSSNLVDSPAAARLGTHRALLYREESGLSEKFRPYRCLDGNWLSPLATPSAPSPEGGVEGKAAATPKSDVARDLSEFRIL